VQFKIEIAQMKVIKYLIDASAGAILKDKIDPNLLMLYFNPFEKSIIRDYKSSG